MKKDNLLSVNKFKDNLKQMQDSSLFLTNNEKQASVFNKTDNNIFNNSENHYKNLQTSQKYLTNNDYSKSSVKQNSVINNDNNSLKNYNNTYDTNNLANNSTTNNVVGAKDLRSFTTNNKQTKSDTNFKIDMSGMSNTIQNQTDVDKVIKEISQKLEQALNASAQGVY